MPRGSFARLVRSLAAAASLAAGAAASACAPSDGPALPRAFRDTMGAAAAAQDAYVAGRWDEAADLFRRQAEQAARDDHLAGWRDEALYNLACVQARAGRNAEAAKAFAESVAYGFREREIPDVDGGWRRVGGALTLPHLLNDPDLAAGEEVVLLHGDGTETPLPVVLYLAPGEAAAPGGERFVRAGAAVAARSAPVAPRGLATEPDQRRWVLEDGDLRWGVDAVRTALDRIEALDSPAPRKGGSVRVADPSRLHLVAAGPHAADVAFAAALAMPDRVAGFVAVGVRTPKPAWADALAAVRAARGDRPPWKVVVGPKDDVVAAALEGIGAEVVRAEGEAVIGAAAKLW